MSNNRHNLPQQSKLFTLYGLKRPDEDRIRYIGITSSSLKLRLRKHITDKGSNTHKDHWINKMFPLMPVIIPIAVELSFDEACDLEIFLIQSLREKLNLVNISNGGTAPTLGRKASEETREKLRRIHTGKKQTPEHIKNSSDARRGWKHSPETILKYSQTRRGRKHSEETKKKMSESQKGKHFVTEEGKLSISRANSGSGNGMFGKKYSEEERKKLAVSQQLRRGREKMERILAEMWR